MYITGTYLNFENRLHTLCQSGVDLASFQTEGAGYTGLNTGYFYDNWNIEFRKKIQIISGYSSTGLFFFSQRDRVLIANTVNSIEGSWNIIGGTFVLDGNNLYIENSDTTTKIQMSDGFKPDVPPIIDLSRLSNLRTGNIVAPAVGTGQLNILGLTNLKSLQVVMGLTGINMSGVSLESLNISSNNFSQINLSSHTGLRTFYADGNRLTSINLSQCPTITDLILANNLFTSIDFSPLIHADNIYAGHNKLLTSINLLGLESTLRGLDLDDTAIPSIEMTNFTNLESFDISNSFATTSVAITNCPKLAYVNIGGCPFISNVNFHNCALSYETIDSILLGLIAAAGAGSLDIAGGTNAVPDPDKILTLQGNGWSVIANS